MGSAQRALAPEQCSAGLCSASNAPRALPNQPCPRALLREPCFASLCTGAGDPLSSPTNIPLTLIQLQEC